MTRLGGSDDRQRAVSGNAIDHSAIRAGPLSMYIHIMMRIIMIPIKKTAMVMMIMINDD